MKLELLCEMATQLPKWLYSANLGGKFELQCHMAAQAILEGKKVLFVSPTEEGKEKMEARTKEILEELRKRLEP